MIYLTRLSGEQLAVNAHLIEFIETTPDTVLSMTTGRRLMVKESMTEVIERIITFYRQIGFSAVLPTQHECAQDEKPLDG